MDFDDFLEACEGGDLARVQQGIPHVNLRQVDSMSGTPLMVAASRGHTEVVKLLIPGSDLRQADGDSNTALMFATYFGHLEMVMALVAGSDLRQVNNVGSPALMWAANKGRVDAVKALIPGSDLSQRGDDGKTALEKAMAKKHWPCVDLLAAHDPEWAQLSWPEATRPEDLPQWFARREREALEREMEPNGHSIASPTKPRNRL